MTDVVEIAIERRRLLASEKLEIEDFIRTAESLLAAARQSAVERQARRYQGAAAGEARLRSAG